MQMDEFSFALKSQIDKTGRKKDGIIIELNCCDTFHEKLRKRKENK